MEVRTVRPALRSEAGYLLRFVWREVYLYWRFVRYDVPPSIMAGMLFSAAAWHSLHETDFGNLIETLAKSLIYFLFYLYPHTIANQIAGIEEDRINKPDRPLVTGESTLRGAWLRFWAAMLIFDLLGLSFGVLEWAVLWQVALVWYNLLGGTRSWFTKDLMMGLGTLALVAAAWQIVRPITEAYWPWLILASVIVFLLVPLQDVRDLTGDKAVGRKTFSVAFGDLPTRLYLVVGFCLLPVAVHFILLAPLGSGWHIVLADLILATLSLIIAGRVYFLRTSKADHLTYMLFCYWFCLYLASAIIVL